MGSHLAAGCCRSVLPKRSQGSSTPHQQAAIGTWKIAGYPLLSHPPLRHPPTVFSSAALSLLLCSSLCSLAAVFSSAALSLLLCSSLRSLAVRFPFAVFFSALSRC